MNIGGGGGSVFELEGSVSVDISGLESDIQSAVDAAEDLQDALNDVSDVDAEVDVDTDDAQADVSELEATMDGITDVSATVEVDTGTAESDAQGVADAVGDIGDQGSGASTDVSSLASTITDILGGAAVTAAIYGVTNALKDMVLATTNAGDTIDKQSDQLGLTRKEYQEWDYIMQLCGSDVANMGRLTNKLADPTKSTADAIAGLGINMQEFSTLSRGDQFAAVISGLQGITDQTARNNAAQEIFGNQWKSVATLLEQSPDFIDNCKQSMEELGMYMSDEDIDAAAAFSDSMTTLNTTMASLKNDIVADILPALTTFFDGISSVVGDLHSVFDSLADPTLPETLDNIGAKFQSTIATINSDDVEATSIISALAELANQEKLTDDQVAEWNALKSQLESIIPGIGELFGEEAGQINGGVEALTAHKDALIADLKAQAAAAAAQEKINALAEESKRLTDLEVEANVQQGVADILRENAGDNLLKAASMMGEDYVNELAKAVQNNTDALGNVDWTSAAAESGLMQQGDAEMRLNAEQQAEYAALVASATTELVAAEESAAAAQSALAEGQVTYDEQVASTNQWIETLNGLTEAEASSASGTTSSASTISSVISGMVSSVGSQLTSMSSTAQTEVAKFNAALSGLKSKEVTISVSTSDVGTKHATGLDYVPFDNYPALLHKGEMVLTSLESKNYRNGGGIGGGISPESVTAMANIIASAVASRPISFGIDSHSISVATRNEMSRQSAARSAQVSSGYGMGGGR